MTASATSVQPIRTIVWDEAAAALLEAYFRRDEDARPCFTGANFERIGGGGDRLDVRERFTAEDIVAVTMLSVRVPAPVRPGSSAQRVRRS